jgi:hypothetical protein
MLMAFAREPNMANFIDFASFFLDLWQSGADQGR